MLDKNRMKAFEAAIQLQRDQQAKLVDAYDKVLSIFARAEIGNLGWPAIADEVADALGHAFGAAALGAAILDGALAGIGLEADAQFKARLNAAVQKTVQTMAAGMAGAGAKR